MKKYMDFIIEQTTGSMDAFEAKYDNLKDELTTFWVGLDDALTDIKKINDRKIEDVEAHNKKLVKPAEVKPVGGTAGPEIVKNKYYYYQRDPKKPPLKVKVIDDTPTDKGQIQVHQDGANTNFPVDPKFLKEI